jgi:hypothetical protein
MQREDRVEDRCHPAGLDEVLDEEQVWTPLDRYERAQVLTHERGEQDRPKLALDAACQAAAPFAADESPASPAA